MEATVASLREVGGCSDRSRIGEPSADPLILLGDTLKRGDFISIDNVEKDERTASAAGALQGRSSLSFMNVPVIEHGALVAVLFVNHGAVRHWTDDERAFIREAGARTHSAVERNRTGAALRELNATLKDRIDRALLGREPING